MLLSTSPAWAARANFFRGLWEGDPVAWIILGGVGLLSTAKIFLKR